MYRNLQNPKQGKTRRNHFLQACKDHIIFTLSNASMHGLIHVVRSKRLLFERFLWIGLVVAGFSVATQQALQVWQRYENGPVVVTVEKDFFNWFVDYPSLVVCYREKVPKFNALQKKYNVTTSFTEWKEYIDDLLFSNYLNYSRLAIYANGSKTDFVPASLYVQLVNDSTARIGKNSKKRNKISITNWPKNVEDEYTVILTEYGACHTFHSKLSHYFDIDTFLGRDPLESTYQNITKRYKDDDLWLIQNKLFEEYRIFAESPNDMIDISSHHFNPDRVEKSVYSLEVVDIISDPAIEDLTPEQRNCKFPFDKGLKHSPVYSYTLCRMECRINLCLEYCHCTPYYYKRIGNEAVCNMTGMYCLSQYPEIITLLHPKTDQNLCPCFQSCNFQKVNLELVTASWFLDPTFSIKFDTFPRERYIRSLIFTKTDLLVQVGGLFGLFLGCSVLSLIEIPYFFSLRFICGVLGNRPIRPEV